MEGSSPGSLNHRFPRNDAVFLVYPSHYTSMSTALHITTGDALESILRHGLHPGQTSEGTPRVTMLSTKADMRAALDGWLGEMLDNPDCEIAVVAVNTTGLEVTCCDQGVMLACHCAISPDRLRLVERGL